MAEVVGRQVEGGRKGVAERRDREGEEVCVSGAEVLCLDL